MKSWLIVSGVCLLILSVLIYTNVLGLQVISNGPKFSKIERIGEFWNRDGLYVSYNVNMTNPDPSRFKMYTINIYVDNVRQAIQFLREDTTWTIIGFSIGWGDDYTVGSKHYIKFELVVKDLVNNITGVSDEYAFTYVIQTSPPPDRDTELRIVTLYTDPVLLPIDAFTVNVYMDSTVLTVGKGVSVKRGNYTISAIVVPQGYNISNIYGTYGVTVKFTGITAFVEKELAWEYRTSSPVNIKDDGTLVVVLNKSTIEPIQPQPIQPINQTKPDENPLNQTENPKRGILNDFQRLVLSATLATTGTILIVVGVVSGRKIEYK